MQRKLKETSVSKRRKTEVEQVWTKDEEEEKAKSQRQRGGGE